MFRSLTRRVLCCIAAIGLGLGSGIGIGQAATDNLLRLATTTSTDNSGLLRYLLPKFEQQTGYRIHVIAVGTGKALRMGRDGDVDVVLVHAPGAEKKFVAGGYGEQRYRVMYNDFVIVGPQSNPAGLDSSEDLAKAMQRIASSQSIFVSRGDDSGTHKKELGLWRRAAVTPHGSWYREAGQGMGKVLQMADELGGYTLTDRGTWLAYQGKSSLQVTYQGDESLYNPYAIIAVNPKRYPDVNHDGAMALIKWITSADGQALVGNFRIGQTQLFKAFADPKQVAQLNGLAR